MFGKALKSLWVLAAVFAVAGAAGCTPMEEPFPGYNDVCGLAIKDQPHFYKDHSSALWTYTSGPKAGHRYIGISEAFDKEHKAYRIFTIAHHCGNHVHNHRPTFDHLGRQIRSTEETHQDELEADCWAAKTLAAAGFDDWDKLFKYGAFSTAPSDEINPSGPTRQKNVRRCAGIS